MSIVWFEIAVSDPEKSLPFYKSIFDWTLTPFHEAPEQSRARLWHIYVNGEAIGGIFAQQDLKPGNTVELYFEVSDTQHIMQSIESLGGQIDLARTKRPDGPGYYARFKDPDGTIIGIWGLQ